MALSSTARVPIGARRCRFVLEQPVETPDGFGGSLTHYEAGPVLWGSIERIGSENRIEGGRGDRLVTHRVTLRYRPGLAPPMRLAAGLRHFAIRTVGDPDGQRRDLVCEVEELIAEAAA